VAAFDIWIEILKKEVRYRICQTFHLQRHSLGSLSISMAQLF
jgi:hypothetical protein